MTEAPGPQPQGSRTEMADSEHTSSFKAPRNTPKTNVGWEEPPGLAAPALQLNCAILNYHRNTPEQAGEQENIS